MWYQQDRPTTSTFTGQVPTAEQLHNGTALVQVHGSMVSISGPFASGRPAQSVSSMHQYQSSSLSIVDNAGEQNGKLTHETAANNWAEWRANPQSERPPINELYLSDINDTMLFNLGPSETVNTGEGNPYDNFPPMALSFYKLFQSELN